MLDVRSGWLADNAPVHCCRVLGAHSGHQTLDQSLPNADVLGCYVNSWLQTATVSRRFDLQAGAERTKLNLLMETQNPDQLGLRMFQADE